MSEATITVDDWVDMFRSIGLDEEKMWQWHRAFEQRHPDAHENFLRWLGLPVERIRDIRDRSVAKS